MRLIEKDLNSGDHIFVRRNGLLYSHHGIYAGEGTVIHFKGAEKEKKDPVVRKTDIENFLNGGKLRRRYYKRRLPRAETLKIAGEHLTKSGYSLAFNNCEHFATYCATGKKKSVQVRKVFGGIVGATFAVSANVIRKKITKKQ
ncbi:MAG: lecithin retinol acyltransferase family protein [Deltaproteobacteria bacterium]|nr:lecithin retinol acyltransferase family protein [Deltaproteobacteria bacterium]